MVKIALFTLNFMSNDKIELPNNNISSKKLNKNDWSSQISENKLVFELSTKF